MYSSANEQVHSEHTEHLLQLNHTELLDTLRALGCDRHIYTLEQLKKEYDDRALFGLITACTLLTVVLAYSTDAFDLDNMVEAGNDLDSKSLFKKSLQGSFSVTCYRNLRGKDCCNSAL
jgi:hypothetical protein